jgi:hypothetical protein
LKDVRAAAAWLGTPLGLVVLWFVLDTFVSTAPGTALVLALVAFFGFAIGIGLLFYVFRE